MEIVIPVNQLKHVHGCYAPEANDRELRELIRHRKENGGPEELVLRTFQELQDAIRLAVEVAKNRGYSLKAIKVILPQLMDVSCWGGCGVSGSGCGPTGFVALGKWFEENFGNDEGIHIDVCPTICGRRRLDKVLITFYERKGELADIPSDWGHKS